MHCLAMLRVSGPYAPAKDAAFTATHPPRSCHMYVKNDHTLPEKSDDEEDMLDEAFHVTEESRLGCQIHLADDLDGLTVHLAPVG